MSIKTSVRKKMGNHVLPKKIFIDILFETIPNGVQPPSS